MDGYSRDRDDGRQKTPTGTSLHTYTPRSHEKLLKSHLELDSVRIAKLQRDLDQLADENDQLRNALENALKDIEDKDDQITTLNNELRRRQRPSATDKPWQPRNQTQYPTSVPSDISKHFNVILQRHHDLLNKKDRQIQQLQNALRNKPSPRDISPTKEIGIQPSKTNEPSPDALLADYTNRVEHIRREYDQIQNVLTNRNKALEKAVDDNQRKIKQYEREIQDLQDDLRQARNQRPGDVSNIEQSLRRKEDENRRLKDTIANLENRTPNNQKVADEIKNVIVKKENTLYKLDNLIGKVDADYPDKGDAKNLEKECQDIKYDLARANDQLTDLMNKLKSPDVIDKGGLLDDMKGIRNDCDDEVNQLKRQLDDLEKDAPPSRTPTLGYAPSVYSFSPSGAPRKRQPDDWEKDGPPSRTPTTGYAPSVHSFSPSAAPSSRRGSDGPPWRPGQCEACSDINLRPPTLPMKGMREGDPSVETMVRTPQRVKPVPSKSSSRPSSKKLINEFHYKKKKKFPRCCGKKASESSNYPYERREPKQPTQNLYPDLYEERSRERDLAGTRY